MKISHRKLLLITLALVIFLHLVRLGFWYAKADFPTMLISNNNPDWKSAVNYITNNSQTGDCAIFFTYVGLADFKFYNRSNSPIPLEIASTPYGFNDSVENNIPEPDLKKIEDLSCSNVWLVLNDHVKGSRNKMNAEKIVDSLRKNYSFLEGVDFYGLNIKKFVQF